MRFPGSKFSPRLTIAVLVVLAVLGIGFANYFLGGRADDASDNEKPSDSDAAVLRLEDAPAAPPLKPLAEARLPWGEKDGIALYDGFSVLETAFTTSDGALWVVDHTETKIGARLRRYVDGKLTAQHDAPPGSVFFSALGPGFGYVIAKGDRISEQAVLVNQDGSVESTYVVPLEINSGGLQLVGDTLYTISWSGFVDPKTKEVAGNDVLVPVAIAGRQVDDTEAKAGVIDAWRIDPEGNWSRKLKSTSRGPNGEDTQLSVERDGRVLEVPYGSVALGIDDSDRIWVLLPPKKVTERAVPGWPALSDDTGMIAVASLDGKLVGAMPIRMPEGLVWPDFEPARRVGFDGKHLTLVDRTNEGVVVTSYEVQP